MHNSHPLVAAWIACTLVALSSCGEDTAQAAERARPVTAIQLRSFSPGMLETVPGVAEPYRESQLAFEVGGRIEFVLETGTEVEGALLDEAGEYVLDAEGKTLRKGTVIARIDELRHQQAVDELKLRKRAAELGLDAMRIGLENVSGPDLNSAQAQARAAELEVKALTSDVVSAASSLDLASATVMRYRELIKTNAISQLALDQSEAEEEVANARLAQARTAVEAKRGASEAARSAVARAEGAILVKGSEIEATRADLATLEQQLEQARTNLASCVLYAPFNGRLTEVDVAEGAYVQPGSVVATLTFLNPMMIAVTVSEADNRRILKGTSAAIYPSSARAKLDPAEALIGYVWEKGEVADPATRTFKIGLITRNQSQLAYEQKPGEPEPPSVSNLFPVIFREPHLPGPLFVNRDTVGEENGQQYVLRVRGAHEGKRFESKSRILLADRVKVRVGSETSRLLNWTFRLLDDPGELEHGDMLVLHPRPGLEEGFVISNKEWVYRPGDLVRVVFDLGKLPKGFYVPMPAISELNGRTSVFVIGAEGRVTCIEVEVHESWNESRRVTSAELKDGVQIVLRGVHFLASGEKVDVQSTVEQ